VNGPGITVLIADDQPLMRAALRMYLTAEGDIDVIGEAADGRQAIELWDRLRPDVVIMDIRMPELDGVAATAILTSAERAARVLVITTFDADEYVVEALRAGASGFLVKDATGEEIVHAVRVIAAGNALLAPSVTRRLLDRYARVLVPPGAGNTDLLAGLTARERDVLDLIVRGMSNAQIARTLHLAESSVKTHVGHLLAKLGRTDRVHLVIFAYENGLAHPGNV
jgi:DNA-binding NarL/FixJ family response regulator